jgi:hypothetical protein
MSSSVALFLAECEGRTIKKSFIFFAVISVNASLLLDEIDSCVLPIKSRGNICVVASSAAEQCRRVPQGQFSIAAGQVNVAPEKPAEEN